jgi:catechol 2,3-dioxygenase-like lactoylglutathione lyase family enzyme
VSTLQDLIPVCYVRDLHAAQAFYELLGLTEVRRGGNDRGGYRYLADGECTLLLTRVDPCPVTAALPLGLYLWSTDVAAVQAVLTGAGVPCQHVGHPDHAPGGELRTADPDGNVVVVGQRTVTSTSYVAQSRAEAGFSILKEAAARTAARGEAPASCEIGERGGAACVQPAEVKLADPWGATVWGCLAHAEEALLNARAAFVATDDGNGLTPWLRHRRRPRG